MTRRSHRQKQRRFQMSSDQPRLVPPPMTADQAELYVLSKCPPGGLFYIPCGQKMEPSQVQTAFERLMMGELIRLCDVNLAAITHPATGKPKGVMCRFFKLTEDGVRRLALLRGTVQLQ